VEILTQIASIVSASKKVALILLEDHAEHCVKEAIGDGNQADIR
jgi:CsoR family transcriptional regulator, copper-sensing transcriptional repressor